MCMWKKSLRRFAKSVINRGIDRCTVHTNYLSKAEPTACSVLYKFFIQKKVNIAQQCTVSLQSLATVLEPGQVRDAYEEK